MTIDLALLDRVTQRVVQTPTGTVLRAYDGATVLNEIALSSDKLPSEINDIMQMQRTAIAHGIDSFVGSKVNSLTGGNRISVNTKQVLPDVLFPTGNDQSSEVAQFINDTGNGSFGFGDFVLASDVKFHPKHNYVDGFGYGLKVFGQGIADTRFLDARSSKGTPLITFTDPDGLTVGKRLNNTTLGGFSILAADTSGALLAEGSRQGIALAFEAVTGSNYGATVNHTLRAENILIDNFDKGIVLDDVTQGEFNNVWIREANIGVWSGANNDMARFIKCRFGAEGKTFAGMNGFVTGYLGRVGFTGGGDGVTFEQCWFMGIDCGVVGHTSNEVSIRFIAPYFERCKQYFKTALTSGMPPKLFFSPGTKFSLTTTNNHATDAKIDLGEVSTAVCEMDGVFGDGTLPNGLVRAGGYNPRIFVKACSLPSGVHFRWKRGSDTRDVTFPDSGAHEYCLGGNYGLTPMSGTVRKVTKGTSGTITCDHWEADLFDIGAMTANVTVAITGGAVPAELGRKLRFRIKAAATTPEAYSVTWPGNVIFNYAFVQPTASDANKYTVVDVEKQGTNYMVTSPQNAWVA